MLNIKSLSVVVAVSPEGGESSGFGFIRKKKKKSGRGILGAPLRLRLRDGNEF